MESIQKIFPDARFIHIIRDGRDVALSYRGLWFGPGDDVMSSARFWSERINLARQQSKSLKYYLEIRYEDLVTNTFEELQHICRFLGLQFQDSMLSYHKFSADRISEFGDRFNSDGSIRLLREDWVSIFTLTQDPPDKSRVARYRREMSDEDQMLYESVAGGLLMDLGYETNY